MKSGVHAGLSSRRSRVQIPSSPPDGGALVIDQGVGVPKDAPSRHHGQVAQLAEHRSEKAGVGSSILPLATNPRLGPQSLIRHLLSAVPCRCSQRCDGNAGRGNRFSARNV